MDIRVIQEETIYENRTSALIRLNIISMEPGVSYSLRYKSGINKIDTLLALGTANGQGPSCYSLISDQSMPVISDIIFEYPDVSEVLYGEVYLLVEGATRNESYEEEGLIIQVDIQEEVTFSLIQINEDKSTTKIPLDYCMYFSCSADKKLYYLDPSKNFLVDVSMNLYGSRDVLDKLKQLEESIVQVKVRGNMLVIL